MWSGQKEAHEEEAVLAAVEEEEAIVVMILATNVVNAVILLVTAETAEVVVVVAAVAVVVLVRLTIDEVGPDLQEIDVVEVVPDLHGRKEEAEASLLNEQIESETVANPRAKNLHIVSDPRRRRRDPQRRVHPEIAGTCAPPARLLLVSPFPPFGAFANSEFSPR